MKTVHTILMLALATSTLASASDKRRELPLSACPQAVQDTIQANSRGGKIDDVRFVGIEGKEIYIADVDLPSDRDLKIYVGGTGTLVKIREDMLLEEAPEAVRRTAAGLGGKVDDVEKETAGELVTWKIEIDRKGQRDLDVVIAVDGRILSQTEDADG